MSGERAHKSRERERILAGAERQRTRTTWGPVHGAMRPRPQRGRVAVVQLWGPAVRGCWHARETSGRRTAYIYYVPMSCPSADDYLPMVSHQSVSCRPSPHKHEVALASAQIQTDIALSLSHVIRSTSDPLTHHAFRSRSRGTASPAGSHGDMATHACMDMDRAWTASHVKPWLLCMNVDQSAWLWAITPPADAGWWIAAPSASADGRCAQRRRTASRRPTTTDWR